MLRAGTLGLLVSTVNAAFAPAPARAAYAGARHALRPGARAAGRAAPSRGSAVHLSCDHATRTCGVHAPSGTNAAAAVAAVAAAPTVRGVGTRAGGPAMVAPAVETAECGAGTSDGEMAKQYVPAEVEERLYAWWEAKGYFKPAPDNGKQCFVVSMPPPNVTGRLHMGHAMFVALEDIMARFHRMRGHPTLWLPGTDHAGIATQMLVERDLKSKGVERVALGREGFLDKVWEWKEEYGGAITAQIRRLGASCDWSRERFTLQPELCEAVTEAFVTLHERGLVYRGEYMVNWSPVLGTAVSDLEVDYVEEQGKLYYFDYPLADGSGAIPVATTRPETILGDACVCVHPEDGRYKEFVGKLVRVPGTQREVPVIADDYVEREFGTGALKVTPAHDVNDYAIGQRHGLPLLNILNKDATMNEAAGKYAGLDRYACRAELWADLEAEGLALKVEEHTQRVPRSQRSGEVIEPLVSTQWFVKMGGMAGKGLEAVRSGETKILPERFEKVYFNWLENIQDWCVSRQLWWGHRIPVWYVDSAPGKYYCARSEEEARKRAEAELGPGVVLRQDDDVLDTWFSSGLWPFATVGWPQQALGGDLTGGGAPAGSDLARFYPSSVMETGYDILFFWVARMMMLGLEFTGKAPFHTIYLHGLVRDAKGQKMSKTKGNVVDPLDTIDTMGTDALRLSLVTGVTPGQDVPLSEDKIQANRNFANKLWNTARFLTIGLADLPAEQRQALAVTGPLAEADLAALALPERYIVSRVHALATDVTAQLSSYDFGPAGQSIYSFLWDEYADWYLEISKGRIASADARAAADARRTLVYVLDTCLRLLHPYMPFITEELWQRLPHEGESIMVADWPLMEEAGELPRDAAAEAEFASLQALVRGIRNARAEYRVEPAKKVAATVLAAPRLAAAVRSEAAALEVLARVATGALLVEEAGSDAAAAAEQAAGEGAVRLILGDGLEVLLPISDLVDADKERARLGKQQTKLEADIGKLEARLSSDGFAGKAPEAVVAKARNELADMKTKLAAVLEGLAKL